MVLEMNGRRWGIGDKFILFISISIVLFMSATFLISQRVFRDHALRGAEELAQAILDQTDKRLAQFFREMQFVARGLAGVRAVRTVDPEGMRDLFISTVLARSKHLRAIYLGTADGRMFEWGVGEGFVDNVPSFPPGYDPRLRPWYLLAVAENGFAVSSPYRYASVDALGITCVLPLRAADGSLSGVLGLDILLEDLTNILQDIEIPNSGRAVLLSREGEIIASQFPTDLGEKRSMKKFEIEGSKDALREAAGSFVGTVGGLKTYFVHKKAESFNWIIAVGMPLESIMEPVRELLNLISAIDLFLMILFVVALGTITSKLIVSPLNHIVSVVDRIEGGEGDARVVVRTSDEFGLLGDELNRLLDTVAENARDLEEKVRQRAEEIWRLQKENTQLRILEERQRIYRDMHDSIGAKLTNVFFCNGVARDLAKGGSKDLRVMHDRIESNCLQAIRRLKEIILGMKEDDRLVSDYSKLLSTGIRQRLKDKGIAFDCRVRNRAALNALGAEARDELEKIFDELVSNVLKHSGASSVRMRMGIDGTGLVVRFSDDGRGFDPDAAGGAVSGLGNIKYRAERLGGTVEVDAGPGRGARFVIVVPGLRDGQGAAREAEREG
jgi:methyl-accepting chemotaxis protein